MRSKLIKILLAAIVLIIFLFGCSLIASADGYSGTTGNLSWTLDEDGMLTISGNGPMKNYTYNNKTEGDYMDYWSLVTGVTIGDGVTTIGKNAFRGFSNLASIAFSESVESIEENAFMYCTGLGDLTIPGTLKSIGNYAFQFSGLRNLIIEEGVTHLGAAVFYCSSLQSVYFPSSLFYTQGGEFQGCEQLRSATLAEGTEYISEFMFNGCSSLQEVILPDSLIYIGENAFIDCSSLATIHLPKNLTDICGGAFSFCKNLRSITIPENVSSINSGVFAYCSNLSDVTILGSETTLSATFSNCASDFTLHCPVGSKAEAFAISKNIPYDNEISGATVEPLDTTGDAIWYTGLGNGNWLNEGAHSTGQTGNLQIPWDVRDPEVRTVQWSIEFVSGIDQFQLNEDPFVITPDSCYETSLKPKNVTLQAGESVYRITGIYNGTDYTGTQKITTVIGASLPTKLNIRAFKTDENGSVIGDEIPIIDGVLTVELGDYFYLNGNMNMSYPGINASRIFMNTTYDAGDNTKEGVIETEGDWGGVEDAAAGIYAFNTRLIKTVRSAAIAVQPWMDPYDSNFMISSPITVRVVPAGQSGTETAIRFGWIYNDYDEFDHTVYTGLSLTIDDPCWISAEIINCNIINYEELEATYGGKPIWSVETISGSADYREMVSDNGDHFWVTLNSITLQPAEAKVKMTCTWGTDTVSKVFNLHVVDPTFTMPTGIGNIPDIIDTKVGEKVVLSPQIQPANWKENGYDPQLFITSSNDWGFAERKWNDPEPLLVEYTMLKAGTYTDFIGFSYGALMVTKEVTFRVKPAIEIKAGGSFWFSSEMDLDQPATYFVADDLELDLDEEDTLFCLSGLFSYWLDNTEALADILAVQKPEFNVTLKDGNVKYKANAYPEDCYLEVRLEEIPQAGTSATFTVSCSLAGQTVSQDVHIQFEALPSRPTGVVVDQPEPLVVKVGDDFERYPPIRFAGGWTLYHGQLMRQYGGWDPLFWDAIDWENCKADVPGVYDIELCATSWNVSMIKKSRLIITKADGTLDASLYRPIGTVEKVPSGLKNIESEAFAGTKFTEIDIPAGVNIADDAFDGTGLIAVYTHNDPNTIAWAVKNRFVAVTE